ncbi:ABC transporter permease subunit, partial [Burkholderia gladioli]
MNDSSRNIAALPLGAGTLGEAGGPDDYRHLRIVPNRRLGRIAGSVLALALLALVLDSVLGNPRWEWGVFAQWFFAPPVLDGLVKTLVLTLVGGTAGFALALPVALARLSASPLLRALAWGYIWLFRSIPLIVLLLLLNNLGYLYETVHIAVPFTGHVLLDAPTTGLVTPFMAAAIGLTLSQAAFSAEAIRGGLLSVDHGQREAAAALGLPRGRQIR